MLEIIDNIYVFSNSRAKFGDIIASRTKTKTVKKDIFSQLDLEAGENEFLTNAWSNSKNKIICLMGNRDGERVPVIFVDGFCGSEALTLVVELLRYDPATLRRCLFRFEGRIAVSDSAREIIQDDLEFLMRDDPNSTCLDSILEAKLLEDIAPYAEKSIYEALQSISHLVGVKIEVSEAGEGERRIGAIRQHFAGSETLGMLCVLALAARELAKDRTLKVRINRFEKGITFSTSFVTEHRDLTRLTQFLSYIADLVGIIHATDMTDDLFRYHILPYVEDVSLLGVKAPDDMILDLCFLGVDITE